MSFWKNLFGGGSAKTEPAGEAVLGEETYKGYQIKAVHMPVGSELQLAGTIEKIIDGQTRSYRFVRADRLSNKDDLIAMALSKGRQIIDEQGDAIFKA